eukprot:CAMPEP_0194342102 /NCGR_PEP_ID=MMETSP0171-20130528/91813_1 /TAXON_ID=218684 /ORGANISM="Corethron pennatum, Strain L29A3" /LENGTH=169 /DNA_ID=CAMNT_0039107695 /DNA_START=128 /DNA_END=636 /DNA_ORIENTATION=-
MRSLTLSVIHLSVHTSRIPVPAPLPRPTRWGAHLEPFRHRYIFRKSCGPLLPRHDHAPAGSGLPRQAVHARVRTKINIDPRPPQETGHSRRVESVGSGAAADGREEDAAPPRGGGRGGRGVVVVASDRAVAGLNDGIRVVHSLCGAADATREGRGRTDARRSYHGARPP